MAPLLGLVGTIYGLISLFASLGSSGLGDNNALARGIALALNATLLGLLTAIPSLIAWSYYNKKVENLAIEMAALCDNFLRQLYHGEEAQSWTSRSCGALPESPCNSPRANDANRPRSSLSR